MLDIAAEAAGHTKGPTGYKISEKYLRDELEEIQLYVDSFKPFWKESGCTIMANGWTGPTSRPLINFLIYSTRGTVFHRSVDTSGHVKDADYLFRLFDQVVDEVGEENVVQFVTDNEPSYKAAGRKLMEKREHLFWSPCAAHCIDLILERIGKKKNIQKIVANARMITTFIYNYSQLVALMRKYTNNHELLRPGITRFATNFIALESLYRHKGALGEMFASRDWRESRIASSSRHTGAVVEVPKLVLDNCFWTKVKGVMSIMEPLIKVLKLVDEDEKPTMGFLYEAMMRARTEIEAASTHPQQYLEIIDERWARQLHHDLHAAGFFLNPRFQYQEGFEYNDHIRSGVTKVIERLAPNVTFAIEATRERIACHIQVFAQSKWLPVTLPIEYYEFARGLEWSIPYLSLPWESGHNHSDVLDSGLLFKTYEEISNKPKVETSQTLQSRKGKLETGTYIFGLPLSPMEYSSFFESQNMKPEADSIADLSSSVGWKHFNRNMFWLAIISGGLMLLHALILLILKFRKPCSETQKHKNYGALVLPRFEIFLIILALPCFCQASATLIRGGSTAGILVAILMLGITAFLLLSLLFFLSVGITMGRLLQYKEVHQEGQVFHWYQEIVRVTLGPGKRGQWTWKNQSNSNYLSMLGPLFEDLRGPPKYMLSQIAGGSSHKTGERIIASDDETEDAEAPFIQKLFGILRIYYTLLECSKRVVLGILAGIFSGDRSSSKTPIVIILTITFFQLFFMVLKKPFIKKKVQFVEILSVISEVGIFGVFLVLLEKNFSAANERKLGFFMLFLFMVGFLAQIVNEWLALIKQIFRLSPAEDSFSSGLRTFFVGLLLIFIPWKFLKNWSDGFLSYQIDDQSVGTDQKSSERRSRSESSGTLDRPWLKQLRELAKASFSREEIRTSTDPSSSKNRESSFWSGRRSGSSTVVSPRRKSGGLYRDLEAIFSSK